MMGDQVRGLRAGLGPVRRPRPHVAGQFPDAGCPAPRAALACARYSVTTGAGRLDVGHLGRRSAVTGSPDRSPPQPSHERGGHQIVSSGSSTSSHVDDPAPAAPRRASAPFPQRTAGALLPGGLLVPHRITRRRLPRIRGVLPVLRSSSSTRRDSACCCLFNLQLHRLRLDNITQPGVDLPQPRLSSATATSRAASSGRGRSANPAGNDDSDTGRIHHHPGPHSNTTPGASRTSSTAQQNPQATSSSLLNSYVSPAC